MNKPAATIPSTLNVANIANIANIAISVAVVVIAVVMNPIEGAGLVPAMTD